MSKYGDKKGEVMQGEQPQTETQAAKGLHGEGAEVMTTTDCSCCEPKQLSRQE